MPDTERIFSHSLAELGAMVSGFPFASADVRQLGDSDLLATQRTLAEIRRVVDASSAVVAGEIAVRSRRELGFQGLAQREGFRTAEKLVQHQTGSSARDAGTLVAVGSLIHQTDPLPGGDGVTLDARESWLIPVGAAVVGGSISPQAADSIRRGLGSPNDVVGGGRLADAVATLLLEAPTMNADALLARARQLRDDIDLAGVA